MSKKTTIELQKEQAKVVTMRGRCSGFFDTRIHQKFETYAGIAMGTVVGGLLAYWLQVMPPFFLLAVIFVFSVIAALVTASRLVNRRSVVLIEMNEAETVSIDSEKGEVTWTVRRKNHPEKKVVVCKGGFKIARAEKDELNKPRGPLLVRTPMSWEKNATLKAADQERGAEESTRKYYILTGTPEKAAAKVVEGLQGEEAEIIRSLNQCELRFWVDEKESPEEAAILAAL